MDITVNADEWGGFEQVRTDELPITGKDGHGQKTPTVRELTAILQAIPDQFQDLPVARYCDEGIRGINHELHYEDEHDPDSWTEHVSLW